LPKPRTQTWPAPSVHVMAASDLTDQLAAHLADPFPPSVAKGEVYDEVDAVTIGADIYGWAMQADFLSGPERASVRQAADALERSIHALPAEARPYYQRLLHLARLALAAI
jgi:hypothetical protein